MPGSHHKRTPSRSEFRVLQYRFHTKGSTGVFYKFEGFPVQEKSNCACQAVAHGLRACAKYFMHLVVENRTSSSPSSAKPRDHHHHCHEHCHDDDHYHHHQHTHDHHQDHHDCRGHHHHQQQHDLKPQILSPKP